MSASTYERIRTLRSGSLSLAIDPCVGGRVVSFQKDGIDVLAAPDVHANNFGSTFWTSPQSDWGWPPPVAIDREPYAVSTEGDALVLTSGACEALGVRVVKRFSPDPAREAFMLEYAIENVSGAPRTYAPWEITRVHPGGLTFFATGTGSRGTLAAEGARGATWYAHDPTTLTEDGAKLFADSGDRFIAHAARGLLFVKTFPRVPPALQAPGEGEIEIYANSRYVEIEIQGPYLRIAPFARLSWTVGWHLRPLAPGVVVASGEASLLALAASTIPRKDQSR